MRYVYIKWVHKHPEQPVHLYSELDDQRYERRKVEVYADGRRGFADRSEEAGGTALGAMPLPPLDEIAAQPEYEPKEIAEGDFQRIWLRRR
jgi:hypothetical protein